MLLSLAVALGLGSAPACELPNPDHCLHKQVDTNAWCADADPDRPYCSPCEATHNGCVAAEPTPDECPSYSASADMETATGMGTDTGTDTGTDR